MQSFLRIIFAVLMLLAPAEMLPAQTPVRQQQTQTKEQTVYITRTGKKYHRDGCRYLAQSRGTGLGRSRQKDRQR